MTTDPEQFALPPQLWFGVLCDNMTRDPASGRLSFQNVFNKIWYFSPPASTGIPPHADLNGQLAVGFMEGVGSFEARVVLRDADGNALLNLTEEAPWPVVVGPGEVGAAVALFQIQHWFKDTGHYYFEIRLRPGGDEHRVHFEVAAPPAMPEAAPPPA